MPAKAERKPHAVAADDDGSRKNSLRGDLKRFTRERLISVAMDCFAEDGFSATPVERIVELAGTTTPTFYRHFESKNDLLIPMQETLSVETRREIAKLDNIPLTFSAIRNWLDEYGAMWRRMHRLCSAYWEACSIDSDLASNSLPSALNSASELKSLLSRYPDKRTRDAVSLRLAMIIPLLDRVFQISEALVDDKLRARTLDEFAKMVLLALTDGKPDPE